MRSRNYCRRGKQKKKSITYSECVFAALVIQFAMRMRHIILSPVACLVFPNFSTLFYERHDFWKKMLLNMKFLINENTSLMQQLSIYFT